MDKTQELEPTTRDAEDQDRELDQGEDESQATDQSSPETETPVRYEKDSAADDDWPEEPSEPVPGPASEREREPEPERQPPPPQSARSQPERRREEQFYSRKQFAAQPPAHFEPARTQEPRRDFKPAAPAAVKEAIDDVNRIIETLRQTLDDMEEILETLELAERQKDADEQEIESLRRMLRQVHRPRDGGHRH